MTPTNHESLKAKNEAYEKAARIAEGFKTGWYRGDVICNKIATECRSLIHPVKGEEKSADANEWLDDIPADRGLDRTNQFAWRGCTLYQWWRSAYVGGCWIKVETIGKPRPTLFNLINATAFQRAESFLKTIGKWKE